MLEGIWGLLQVGLTIAGDTAERVPLEVVTVAFEWQNHLKIVKVLNECRW